MDNSGPRVFTWGALASSHPTPTPSRLPPTHPLAKPGNFILKSLNRCFSNYYQVRTWRVFTETVTYIVVILHINVYVYNSFVLYVFVHLRFSNMGISLVSFASQTLFLNTYQRCTKKGLVNCCYLFVQLFPDLGTLLIDC